MPSIDWAIFCKRIASWLCMLALLTSCALPQLQKNDEENAAGGAAQNESDFEPIPDPYLTHAKALSQAARSDFELAQQAMRAQQWQQAQTLLEQMTQLYPELSGPYVNLALVYRQLNQDEKAAAALERAIAVNPLNGEAYNQLAIMHREQGEFAEAEKLYLQALDVWPHNPIVHRNLGILYDLYMGRFADALRHYQMSQKVSSEPERRVQGWIVDLQRRINDRQAAAQSQ